ncbi:MAG: hypothetical protein ACI9JN_000874 [Bacteroidia bacterium]|jgi:hypothetical protein
MIMLLPTTTKNLVLVPLFVLVLLMTSFTAWSQNNVGIGTLTPASDAILDLSADDKGLLVPRLTTNQRLAYTPIQWAFCV